ncbi:hypothetical protein HMI55_003452 [Coelomomyces lativittatus]|nr:hypothetical protein HMI55_003452 [Coelomomyces lativittatus]
MFPLLVSSRVMVNDRLGTVKYLGPIDNLSGEWLGIDWDQPNYGKHDGSYRGKRYFQTKFTSSGSFIRYIPNVVHTGISFANALTNKYANKISNLHLTSQSSSSSSSTTSPFLSTSTKKLDQDILEYNWEQKDISIEVFGLNKLAKKQCFENLEEVDLSNFPVRILKEEIEHLKSTCFNLTHLDLSGTLIQSWSELAILCKALPQLLILLLNRTRLTFSDDQLDFNLAFNRIQSLSLNETFPDIRNLESILPFFPNLQTLNLASNELESLPDFSKTPHLTVLDIQKNKIHVSKWKNLTSLSLNQLRVQENGISDLNDVPVDLYVEHLNLSHNALQEWSDINQLGSWKKLQHLRIHDNPLYHDPRNGRMQVISRLSQLKMLNGSEVNN